MLRAILVALTLCAGSAQELPLINADGIIPNRSSTPHPLKPGMEVSIYGQHLGPKTGCAAERSWKEARELCGTTVTVGGAPAALLYVQEAQINLRVPFTVPTEGIVPFVVTRNGRASPAVTGRFAAYSATITPPAKAYVDMPIWIEVQLPDGLSHSLRYPVTIRPGDFGGHQFEVRHRGVLIPPISARHPLPVSEAGPGGFGSIGRGSLVGLPHEPPNPRRLPLHLLYRFDTPGWYEVRYVGYDWRYPTAKHVMARSPWIRLQISTLPPGYRQAWLDSNRNPPSDPVEWLSDYLPSLLAVPDTAVLPALKKALYHPHELVRQYALYSLAYFNEDVLGNWIPATIQSNGPTTDLAYFLSWRRAQFQPHGSEIVHSVLPYMKSTSPLLVSGALQTLCFMKPHFDWKAHPEIPGLLDRAVAAEAERLIGTHNAAILQPLALYLGVWKSETSRRLLRQLVAEGTVREQAEICLRWVGESASH
jgi:hypothetical protein